MINTTNNCNIYLKISDVSATTVEFFELRTLLAEISQFEKGEKGDSCCRN